MMTSFRILTGALLVTTFGLALRAADKPAPASGKVLLLDNERTPALIGDVERHGDQYRVRRPVGETWVPADKVLTVCATREEAYAFLRKRANLVDADERLRLAQWCYLNGLREQALAEVTAAVEMRPNHAESRRLLRNLQRPAETVAAKPQAEKNAVDVAPSPPLELTQESLGRFVRQVQPVLMNACASCHASGKTTAFKLVKAFEGGTANRKTLQANLASVVAQINVDNPELSPLLLKAVGIHGDMAQPALKGRQTPAFKLIEDWVQLTLANNPQLRHRAAPPVALLVPESPAAEGTTPAPTSPVKPAANPEKPAGTGDAFDPAVFNRQMHPEKKDK
jgi:hypothetical protein